MANARDFPITRFPLYDITVPALAPASTGVQSPVTGAVGTAAANTYLYVTANTIPNGTSQLPSGLGAEALIFECISPVVQLANGTLAYPDFQFAPMPDSTSLRNPTPAGQLFFDGSYGANMAPPREQTVGRAQACVLGLSLRQLLTEAVNAIAAGRRGRANMAMQATGLKYVSTFQFLLSSLRGWGTGVAGDTVIVPGRIRVFGERYSDAMLAQIAGGWNGTVSYTDLRRQLEAASVLSTISGTQAGQVSVASLPTLSGGYNQSGLAIWPDWRFSYNLVTTATGAAYPLSNSQQAGGANGNVDPQYSGDLGMPFAPVNGVPSAARSALITEGAGVVPGIPNIAFAGVQYAGATVPDPAGWPVGTGVDDLAYGQVQPLRQDSGLYLPIPSLEQAVSVLGENAVWFVTANGTAGIALKTAAVALRGRSIQLAQQALVS